MDQHFSHPASGSEPFTVTVSIDKGTLSDIYSHLKLVMIRRKADGALIQYIMYLDPFAFPKNASSVTFTMKSIDGAIDWSQWNEFKITLAVVSYDPPL